MRKRNYKGRCEKRNVPKCEGVCKTYDALQSRMVDILSEETIPCKTVTTEQGILVKTWSETR